MSINNPYSDNILNKLIKGLTETELKEVIDFIEFIKEKERKISKSQKKRVSLQGIISNSKVTDEDIEEAKKIWK